MRMGLVSIMFPVRLDCPEFFDKSECMRVVPTCLWQFEGSPGKNHVQKKPGEDSSSNPVIDQAWFSGCHPRTSNLRIAEFLKFVYQVFCVWDEVFGKLTSWPLQAAPRWILPRCGTAGQQGKVGCTQCHNQLQFGDGLSMVMGVVYCWVCHMNNMNIYISNYQDFVPACFQSG